jgi:membrane protein implicated in regulation of membrane protease activity
MGWPVDTLAGVFLFLFAFGLIFSVATFLIGAIGGHIHIPGSSHAGHAGHLGHHGHGPDVAGHATQGHGADVHGGDATGAHPAPLPAAPGPLNVGTLMIFLTWFGATGYALRTYYGAVAVTSLLAASLAGLVGATLVWALLAKVLWRGQTEPLDPYNYQIEGVIARVTSPIRAGGTGEIVYTLDGKRRVDGARNSENSAIPAGVDVAILRYERGLAYVTPLGTTQSDIFLAPETGEAAPDGDDAGPDAGPRAAKIGADHELAE